MQPSYQLLQNSKNVCKLGEIDHPNVPSHKMWLKDLALTVHDHNSLLSETGWLGSNMILAAQTILRKQLNSFV